MRAPTIYVTWLKTERHQAPIPIREVAEALGVEPGSIDPYALDASKPTGALLELLTGNENDDSHLHGDRREIVRVQPGPAPRTVDALLGAADELLDGEHATTGLSDAGRLLEELVAAVRASERAA
ncbi:hypothetical protein [Micromonospora sp. NPDC049662]|uniref:hypothetical protein n=1 Tax=Micromonospora sp. NPDC049662 TaxID=3155397 RepID=UPI00344A2469